MIRVTFDRLINDSNAYESNQLQLKRMLFAVNLNAITMYGVSRVCLVPTIHMDSMNTGTQISICSISLNRLDWICLKLIITS